MLWRPDERPGIAIVLGDVAVDSLHQFRNAVEDAATDSILGNVSKKAFDHV